jgi:hypothetical protein
MRSRRVRAIVWFVTFAYFFSFASTSPAINQKPSARPKILSLSTTSAVPFSLLEISGSGFDPTASITVRFFAKKYSLSVPVVAASATALTVAVPPFTLPTGKLAPGVVSVQVVQKSGTSSAVSKSVINFQIQDLPTPSTQPGALSLSFLEASADVSGSLQHDIKGTFLDTPELNAALANQVANLQAVIPNAQAVMQGGSHTIGTIDGNPITIKYSDLQSTDRMILGMLLALGATPPTSSKNGKSQLSYLKAGQKPPGVGAAAINYIQAAMDKSDPQELKKKAIEVIKSIMLNGEEEFLQAFKIVATDWSGALALCWLIGVPAALLEAPALALFGVTIGVGVGLIAVGGVLYQSNPTYDAAKIIIDGEELIIEGFIDEIIGDLSKVAGNLKDIYACVLDKLNALFSIPSPPPPPPPTQCLYQGDYVVSLTGTIIFDDPHLSPGSIDGIFSFRIDDQGKMNVNLDGLLSFDGGIDSCQGPQTGLHMTIDAAPDWTVMHLSLEGLISLSDSGTVSASGSWTGRFDDFNGLGGANGSGSWSATPGILLPKASRPR